VIERTIDKRGQQLLVPQIESGWFPYMPLRYSLMVRATGECDSCLWPWRRQSPLQYV